MIKQKRFLLSLIILVTLIGSATTQNVGIDSPYGRYGYGVLSKPTLGATESMGGISYGIRRGSNVNPGNPASYSAADTLNFTMEMGVSGQYSKLSDGTNNQSFQNGNFDYLAFQFPVYKNIGVSVGLLPYSKVGYDFGRDVRREDIPYRETFNGSGGLSQVYGGVAYSPVEFFSVGANVSYLFGSIKHSRELSRIGTGEASNQLENTSFTIKNAMFDFGAQFTYPINERKSMTLGVVYTPSVKNKATVNNTNYLYSSTDTQLLPSDTLENTSFDLPQTFGVGLSYTSVNWLVGIDGTFQQWNKVNFPDELDNMTLNTRFNDKFSVGLGAEYVADPVNRNFFKRVRLRGGLSYSNSYTNMNIYDPNTNVSLGEHGYKEYGVNVGFGLPFRDMISGRISMINLGFGYSIMDPEHKYMIKEEMFKVSVNININEFWFFKRQFD